MQKIHTKNWKILFKQNTENIKYYIQHTHISRNLFVIDVEIAYVVLRQICFSLD